ncbi:MAG: IS66 family insertion sequence element accessory protein TnpB [Sterolibacteriaceae bacterium]|nr:IS66 family insertion sequence element accessory protein TnpB [Candidatus Methylophosphatis haderslevensis]
MIPSPHQVWLVVEPIDMRAGIDGLSQRIQNTLGRSPCDGSAYAFRNRRLNRLKLLVWGWHRRVAVSSAPASGALIWPRADTAVFTLSAAQWQWLVSGVDWQRLEAPAPAHWRV